MPENGPDTDYRPVSGRAKVLYFIWKMIPRTVLLGMIILIVVMFGSIKTEMKSVEAEKASAMVEEKPLVNIVVMPISLKKIRDAINLPGSIDPWTDVSIKAEVPGTLYEVAVKEGDRVKAGDVIARIETDDYRIALDRAQAAYRLALSDLKRDRSVYGKGIISEAQMETKQTNASIAEAEVANAKLQLERCTIKAPISGVVTILDAKKGLLMSVGDPVAQIVKMDRVKAVVGIPESDMPAVSKLTQVELTIKALDEKKVVGERYFLSPVPDSAARIYRLELSIDNPDGEILPGMFIRADVVKKEVQEAVTVPFYSVISKGSEQYVFIEKDGKAVKKNVTLGIMEKWMVQVTSGLEAGENLIVEGHRDVEDGLPVKVVHTVTEPGQYTF